jgi:hypothetical protein
LLSPAVIVAAIGTLWIARYRKDERLQKLTIIFLVGAFVFFFMQTRLSVFLWEKIPFMPLFAFPWRMMGPFALMTSILAGFALASLFDGRSKLVITSTEIIFLCLCIMNAAPHLRNNKPLPEQIAVQLPRILDAKAIAQNGLSASVLDEYLPKAADPEIWRIPLRQIGPVVRSVPAIHIDVLKNSGTEILLTTRSPSSAWISFARWFFPVWECNVNSLPYKLEKSEVGAVNVSVPPGVNSIALSLKPLPARRITCWISLLCLAIWGGICVFLKGRRRASSNPSYY